MAVERATARLLARSSAAQSARRLGTPGEALAGAGAAEEGIFREEITVTFGGLHDLTAATGRVCGDIDALARLMRAQQPPPTAGAERPKSARDTGAGYVAPRKARRHFFQSAAHDPVSHGRQFAPFEPPPLLACPPARAPTVASPRSLVAELVAELAPCHPASTLRSRGQRSCSDSGTARAAARAARRRGARRAEKMLRDETCPLSTGGRDETCPFSTGVRDETCPLSMGGRDETCGHASL